MSAKKPSLAEFNATKMPPPCWLCSIPERGEADDNYANNGVGRRIIREWLIEARGYPEKLVTESKIDKHYKNRHHIKAGSDE